MKVIITSEDELRKLAANLLRLSVNMRKAQKDWEQDHGSARKDKKKYWESQMDDYLLTLVLEKTEDARNCKIKVQDINKPNQ